jgi:hypothetical protein
VLCLQILEFRKQCLSDACCKAAGP